MGIKARRELDILIGETIFGIKHTWMAQGYYKGEPVGKLIECQMVVKPYSTDIAAAWEVAEKVFPEFYLSREELYENTDDAGRILSGKIGYALYVEMYKVEEGDPVAQAETAPLAICLAALKTIGHSF